MKPSGAKATPLPRRRPCRAASAASTARWATERTEALGDARDGARVGVECLRVGQGLASRSPPVLLATRHPDPDRPDARSSRSKGAGVPPP